MRKYKVSWYDETENVWKSEIVEAKWYDDAFNTEMSETAKYYEQLREMSDEEITKNYETFNKDN